MPKFIVDLDLDGYKTQKEEYEACIDFIYDQLNMTSSVVKISPYPVEMVEQLRKEKSIILDALLSSPCMLDEIAIHPAMEKKKVHSSNCFRCKAINKLEEMGNE